MNERAFLGEQEHLGLSLKKWRDVGIKHPTLSVICKRRKLQKQARSIRYQFKFGKLIFTEDIDDFVFDGTPINDAAKSSRLFKL